VTITKATLFDVNHTILGIADEAITQSAAIDVLFGEVCTLKHEALDRTIFRNTFDRAWTHGKRASFEKYEETTYESIVTWVLEQYELTLGPSDLERILQIYMAPLYDAAYIIAGMDKVLKEAKSLGKVGVITNYKYGEGMRGFLRRIEILEDLDCVAISSEIGWKKPDERIYKVALDQLGLKASEVVVVGNELEKDLWRAHAMGMRTIHFEPSEHSSHDVEYADVLRERLDAAALKLDGYAETPDHLLALLSGFFV
jgi:putative hydrolase of the HAD superfamily